MSKKKSVERQKKVGLWNVGFKRPPDISENFIICQIEAENEAEVILTMQSNAEFMALLALIQRGEQAGRHKPDMILPLIVRRVDGDEDVRFEGKKREDNRMSDKFNRINNTAEHHKEIAQQIAEHFGLPLDELLAISGDGVSIPAMIQAGKDEVEMAKSQMAGGGIHAINLGEPGGLDELMQMLGKMQMRKPSRKQADC